MMKDQHPGEDMNESDETKDKMQKEDPANSEAESPAFVMPENVSAYVRALFDKEERTPEEEKEVEEALFGKPRYTYQDKFRWFYFVSLSKTLDFEDPTSGVGRKEWVGDTKTNEIVVIRYTSANGLMIGIGFSELKARINLEPVARNPSYDPSMTIERVNSCLRLEWRLPDYFIDE